MVAFLRAIFPLFLVLNTCTARRVGKRGRTIVRIDELQDDEALLLLNENTDFWFRLTKNTDSWSLSVSLSLPATSPPTHSSDCAPTTGPCVASKQELVATLNAIEGNAAPTTVALCRDTTIQTPQAIQISSANVKLCCETTGCRIESQGSDRNLIVSGSDFTLDGIDFLGGSKVENGGSGGNVAIEASGNLVIRNCTFSNGNSDYLGGNLFIDTPNNVTIYGSTFENGQVRYGGGGLAVLNALGINIQSCTFVDNAAESDGGGFIVFGFDDVDQEIFIRESTFVRNKAFYGGGFLATSFGEMPRLDVQHTMFNDNEAEEGAAAAVFHSVKVGAGPLDLTLKGNSGVNNRAFSECNGIYAYVGAGGATCFDVSQDYSRVI